MSWVNRGFMLEKRKVKIRLSKLLDTSLLLMETSWNPNPVFVLRDFFRSLYVLDQLKIWSFFP